MTIYHSIFALLVCVILISCKDTNLDDRKTYHKEFETGFVPGLQQFEVLNKQELGFDSMLMANAKIAGVEMNHGSDFVHNRSRIYMDSDPHNKILGRDTGPGKPIAMPCHCNLNGDTLQISMVVGFFGGAGFELQLYKDKFRSNFLLYTDDVKPYKAHLSDTAFSSEVRAESRFQFLVLDEKPAYKPNQQLTGYLTFTSNRFYELSAGKLDSSYVIAKIYFTCNTQ